MGVELPFLWLNIKPSVSKGKETLESAFYLSETQGQINKYFVPVKRTGLIEHPHNTPFSVIYNFTKHLLFRDGFTLVVLVLLLVLILRVVMVPLQCNKKGSRSVQEEYTWSVWVQILHVWGPWCTVLPITKGKNT